MVSLNQNDDALQTIENHNVTLKEEIAFKLLPPANDKDLNKSKERRDIALRLAKLSKR